ncbi:esterase/lipase family protein [Streptomyces sp. NPDC102406]|uniref:esterase/lipase family protein n=1 Tax=Streptomyces sp. NPDC102406 TaxID=3366171 RepID=UPI003800D667
MSPQRQAGTDRHASAEHEVSPHVTQDAVVIVPGIMGSELRSTATGDVLWGLSGARWLLRAWTRRDGLAALHLTEDELAGKTGRVRATQLLRHGTWTPYLRGQEPYTDLIDTVRDYVADPAAVLPFPYDWRLPVATNGRLLAARAREHLTAWRAHPAHRAAVEHRADRRPARLVFIAHSMGGLVTRSALDGTHSDDLAADTRTVITLGTPFYGSVKATVILNSGRGAPVPLPHARLRALCATMPGLHDLLPLYRCLRTEDDVRRLDVSDIAALGGHPELARDSLAFHARQQHVPLPDHRTVVGTRQPTWQSLSLSSGRVTAYEDGPQPNSDGSLIRDRDDRVRYFAVHGDGTVYRAAAALSGHVSTVPVQHGDLARADSALDAVADILLEDLPHGIPLGEPGCGLAVPDLAEAGVPWRATAENIDSAQGLTCTLTDTETGVERPVPVRMEDGRPTATITARTPGLYRVELHTYDRYTISQLVLVTEPGVPVAEADD